MILSRSSLILGMIQQFSAELCLVDLEIIQIFAVYVHSLCGCFHGRGGISASLTSLVPIKLQNDTNMEMETTHVQQ